MMLAMLLSALARAQIPSPTPPNSPNPVAQVSSVRLRVLGAAGKVLPAGSRVELRVEWYLENKPVDSRRLVGMNEARFNPHTVDSDGLVHWTWGRGGPPHYRGWLHVRIPETEAPRRRAFVPWPLADSSAAPIELELEPEQSLFAGRIVDESGQRVALDLLHIQLSGAAPESPLDAMRFLGARVLPTEQGYEVFGWPMEGTWQIGTLYGNYGPELKPRALKFAQRDVDLVLPDTGHIQVQVSLPKPFPQGALEAVYQHEHGGVPSRQPIFDRTTNHRLRAGVQRMHIELAGDKIVDMGEVEVPHGAQHEVKVTLPPTLRVHRISVFALDGTPIRAVWASSDGSNNPFRFSNDANKGYILVATIHESVDLVIQAQDFETLKVSGVTEDRRVELKPVKR